MRYVVRMYLLKGFFLGFILIGLYFVSGRKKSHWQKSADMIQ